MIRYTHMACALACVLATACALPADDRPATFNDLALGEQVPHALLLEAADAAEPCMGRPYDLDGWTAWVVDDGTQCLQGPCFRCAADTLPTCGPRPPGCDREEDCPCECGGATDFASKRIALAPGLVSLQHEVKHAGWELTDPYHREPEWKRCP